MSTLIERMREVMASKKWTTPQEVAKVAGVSRSAAAQWLGQGSKIIHTIGNQEAAENLEKETGFCALWIAKGTGPKYVAEQRYPARDPDHSHHVLAEPTSPPYITASPLWPLKKSTVERIRALTPAQQRIADDAFDVILKGFEAEGK